MNVYKKEQVLLGRYRISSFLDAGGMQEVYVAVDETFARTVAVKVPKNGSAEKRFKRSAVLSAQVNHPNVAKTLDFFEHKGAQHLVEEYVAGENLRQRLDRYEYFDPFLAAHVTHHIAKGVAASHHVGVFHRDMKPSNILLSKEPWPISVKVSDFGISRMAKDEIDAAIELGVDKSITTSATLVGALPYMSPEAISDSKSADLPADIWAIGAILYEMLSGVKPYGQGLVAVSKIMGGKPPPTLKNRGNETQFGLIFSELLDIVKRCLVGDPKARITADALIGELSKLCYSISERERGIVKLFGHGGKPIGFIHIPGDSDVFFHRDCCYGDVPAVGENVEFARHDGGGADRAFPVVRIK